MKRIVMLLFVFVALMVQADPSVMGVTARQRYPWNGEVDISYTVENAGTEYRELAVCAIDQMTGITNVAKNVTGETAYASGQHHIVWDMTADGLTFVSTNVIFAVSYVEKDPLYCVIDLAGGTSASLYPVSYLPDVPSGGWSDEYKTTKIVLRKIKSGTFTMGYRSTDYPGASDYQLHQVTLTKDYYMGVFPVTQRQWELVTGKRPSYFNNNTFYASRPVEQVSYDMIRGSSAGAGWPNSSAVDATSFLGVLREKSGLTLDLPTDAEWEYVCRAGTVTALNSGKNLTSTIQDSEMDKVGRYWYNGGSSYSQGCDTSAGTAKVGSYAPNAWGLYDLHGNVLEWCLDWSGSYADDATDATDPKGSSSSSCRVLRGGSWNLRASSCCSAHRTDNGPSYGYNYYGFRLVRTLSNTAEGETAARSEAVAATSDESDPVRIDLTEGTRTAAETEVLAYSTNWVENAGADAIAVVTVDGDVISAEARVGVVEWKPSRNGTYELTHTIITNGVAAGEPLTATFIVGRFPETPVFNPASGTTFDTSLTVTMTCDSEDATIHYTIDGTTPTMESTTYKKFKIYGKTTVKAIAFYDDGAASDMAVVEYAKGLCEAPIVTPPGGTVFEHSGQVVSLAHDNPEGVLRYTIDGSDPTAESPEYTEPFTIDETTVVRAKVFGDQYFDSSIVTATLTRVWLKVATPDIAAEAQFTGSKQKVTLACDTEGALIRYTTNGNDPNSHSPKYTKPFYVTDTTTVKAYATKADYTNSDIATFLITKVWGIGDTMGKPDHKFETSGDKGFVRVEDTTATLGESMKSGAITDNEKSILSTTVIGPGTLTFKWKASCEQDDEYEWDHGEFKVNGKLKGRINGITDWIEVSQRIEGEGEHTVTWIYIKDDVEAAEQDCIWVSDYAWASDYTETRTTEVPVPYSWLLEKSRDAVDEYDIYEKVAKQTAANPKHTVEQCYVAGLNPESPTDDLKAGITIENGIPVVTWDPDLNEDGTKSVRAYSVWGSETLEGGGSWHSPTNALDRFFRVTVEMP